MPQKLQEKDFLIIKNKSEIKNGRVKTLPFFYLYFSIIHENKNKQKLLTLKLYDTNRML